MEAEITPELLLQKPAGDIRSWTGGPPRTGQGKLGVRTTRVEDHRFVTGAGHFMADLIPVDALHVVFVRTPMASAAIAGIEITDATAAPGVVAVVTAENLDLEPLPAPPFVGPDLARPPLARSRVRFVGEIVAAVVAQSREAAVDAAELVEVSYEELPCVVDPLLAVTDDAHLIFPGETSNMYFDTAALGATLDPSALDDAEVIVEARFRNQRMAGAAIETNAALAAPEGDGIRLTVPSQIPFDVRATVSSVLGLQEDQVRVVVPDVGGAFGTKSLCSAEYVIVGSLARRLGRAVFWSATRTEDLQTMPQGRGQVQDIRLGLTSGGKITGVEIDVIQDGGAYPTVGVLLPMVTRIMTGGPYRVTRAAFHGRTVATNTTPVAGFRGAGRPEATYVMERALDLAAARLGIDPVALRLANLIGPDEFPWSTPLGTSYDSGDYGRALELACEHGRYDELRHEQAQRRSAGDPVALGIGVSCYVEITAPGIFTEYGAVRVNPDGRVTASVGSSAHGQGHETVFAMIVADSLGLPLERVDLVQSDTAVIPRGAGTRGSRSLQLAGSALRQAADEVADAARKAAADELEASPEDILIGDDGLWVRGVPSSRLSWSELASRSEARGRPLVASIDFDQGNSTFPFGAHLAAVEVDTETGRTVLRRLVAVDDCGTIINPLIVEGQVHGGAAQGVAQALFEGVAHDELGNPLTATLMDYLVPGAPDLAPFEAHHTEVPSPRNPLGAKGIGESATIGATPAVHNAVMDALRPYGIEHIDMPVTPEKVWRALSGRS